jgi:hypothetical protein
MLYLGMEVVHIINILDTKQKIYLKTKLNKNKRMKKRRTKKNTPYKEEKKKNKYKRVQTKKESTTVRRLVQEAISRAILNKLTWNWATCYYSNQPRTISEI